MTKASRIALIAVSVSLAACSDNTMAPAIPEQQAQPDMYAEGSTQDLASTDTVKFSITIDPSRQTYYNLGAGNSLTFPAGSLCDPNKSSYGENEWDKACTKANSPLTVQVKAWIDSKGHARVDFDKHLRFVPSNDPSKWVVITFADMQAALDPFFNILYCPNENSKCKDESKTDPTLRVTKNPLTGKITRRIKHFSGYNVAAGRDAEIEDYFGSTSSVSGSSAVALATPILRGKRIELLLDNERMLRPLSGYILASG